MATLSGRMRDSGSLVREKSVNLLDSYVPPSQRQEYFDSIRSWAAVNPKLAAFVAAQLLLSGPPVLIFLGFSFTILISSFLICLLTALTVTFAFTALCTGLALLVLLPTLLLTSTAATFLFMSGLISGAAVSRFNNDPRTEGIRSRTKSNAAAMSHRVKDASNGTVDLNAAAEHISKRVADAMPQSADEPASDKRAREYLARQALGIPENYESSANGSGSYPQRHQGTAYLNLKDDPHVQSAVRPHTDGDQVAQAAPQFGSKPQAVP
ncbi:MAG: hypothetical protein Q9159_006567 [Coniocarpon cinnabarinum]